MVHMVGNKDVRVTPQQAKLAEIVAEETRNPTGDTKENMLRRAGYSVASSKSNHGRAFTSEGFKYALEQLGVTDDKIATVFREAMNANTVVTYKGDAIETDAPDHKVRLQAADKLSEITGMKKKHIKVESVNLNLTSDDIDGMLD